MTTVSGGVKGLVARAQREAQRRAQSPSTAYLLLVMLQTGGPMGKLLSGLGVKESDLLSAIRVVDSEPTSALERAVEQAYRLAKVTEATQVLPAHLLLAIARDTRSAAHRSLEVVGAGSRRVQEAVQDALRPEDAQTPPSSTYVRPSASFSAPTPRKPSRPSARRKPEAAPLIELRVEPATEDAPEEEILIEAPIRAPIAQPAEEVDDDELIVPSSSPFSLDAGKYPTLAQLGRNLTEMASLGRIDEVIGRDDEIERLLDVLA
ncbi:MAG: Clp protease N-terminal domain-containing protein, partial [Polyangiales bacterium]